MVFGHVIQGEDVVRLIESQPTDANNHPHKDIRISHCGELVLQKVKCEYTVEIIMLICKFTLGASLLG